jgi:dTDP-4-amino-4,6-dideoxygalactose transaminase
MQSKVPFLDLRAHHQPHMNEFMAAIQDVIESSAFAGGPFVARFEEKFAEYCGCGHAAGLGSGTEALWFALLALGVGPGDEVITVPSTFMATAEAITYCGARPVFVDIEDSTYTMDPDLLEAAITPKTKAIIPVHLFGQTADMDPILRIAEKHGLRVIEDACQAHGATYRGRRAGAIADAGCFSFYPGKNLGAFGEAGATTTGNRELWEKICVLRDHGQVRKYYHSMVGWNGRMDGIQAAVLSIKLSHLEMATELRRSHAAQYHEELAGIENVIRPQEAPGRRHVYHLYAIRVPHRDQFIAALTDRGIGSGIHYPVPVHLQECYRELGYGEGSFPVAEKCAREFVSLPMYPELTPTQVSCVADAVKGVAASVVA